MASSNLFTPAFGGLPQVFFGRKSELDFAQAALGNENSPHKAFFITGNRGCGKTTLLERVSRLAAERGLKLVDGNMGRVGKTALPLYPGMFLFG